jgi:hypothetical protein
MQLEDASKEDQQRMEHEEVIALRYLENATIEPGYFGVWWNDELRSYTEEPWAHLVNFGADFLRELRDVLPGRKVQLTGKRKRRRGEYVALVGRTPTGVLHQQLDGYCALNAVRNLVTLPDELVRAIQDKGPLYSHTTLSRQLIQFKGCPVRLEKVKGQLDKLAFLYAQTQGLFLVCFHGHCLSWNATERLLCDTDPRFPEPLAITAANVALLQIQHINLIYRLVGRFVRS